MKLDLRMRGFPPITTLRTYLERRLTFALDRHEDRIARVRVTLGDVNGPKGGDDKRCQVDVALRDGRAVRATAQEADAQAAADVAIHRAARGVSRAVDRLRATAAGARRPERARPGGQI